MHPQVLPNVSAYGIALVLAVVSSALMGAYRLRCEDVSRAACLRLQLALTVAGLLGAKLHSLVERGGAAVQFKQELMQGYRYPGAAIGVLLVLAVFGRRLAGHRSVAALGDAIAPSIGIGAAILRVGCLLSGCCFGVPTNLPWALRFPAQSPPWHAHVAAGLLSPVSERSLPVHPLQIYFMLLSLVAAIVASRLAARHRPPGQALLTFVAIDGIGKALLETLRGDPAPGVQLVSMLLGIAAAMSAMRGARGRVAWCASVAR